ncbi:MAG: cation diffusion facilitator family transporter, partial [Mycobacterium sp.]|nr:cation diffusion facilitator family transporter [Mycobacterium sp.]
MSTSGSTRAIMAALFANAGIAVAKFVGFLITQSSSMLAESLHSVADTSNQALLLFGQRQARREATSLHQFGYGRSRFFYSFVVALVLFTLGAVFAIYEGIHKIGHPEPLRAPLVAIGILMVAIGLESYSFRTAMVESKPLKGNGTW